MAHIHSVTSLGGALLVLLLVEIEGLDDVLVDEGRRAKGQRNPNGHLHAPALL